MNPTIQRLSALQRANHVRARRAELKRQLHRREVGLAEVLASVPEWARDMELGKLLESVRAMGQRKAARVLLTARVPHTRQLGNLSAAERARVLMAMRERCPGVVVEVG